jgi:DnaJ-class molecular chaperone
MLITFLGSGVSEIKISIKQEIAKRILEREKLRQAAGVTTCKCCHGAGWIIAIPTRKCPECNGTGKWRSK